MFKEAIHITSDGSEKKVIAQNAKKFTLEEMQKFVGGYIDMIRLPDGRLMIVNDEGKLNGLPVNQKASEIFREQFPIEKFPHNKDGTILKKNVAALEKWGRAHPNESISEAIVDKEKETIAELCGYGMRCALKGCPIVPGDLRWSNCEADVVCFQHVQYGEKK